MRRTTATTIAITACLSAVLLTGCGRGEESNGGSGSGAASEASGAGANGATSTEPTGSMEGTHAAGLSAGWNDIEPGGDTVCSDGSDYRFFARPGDPDKLVVYFQGGGACWFGANCDLHLDPSYKPTVEDGELDRYAGIFDFDHPENPFADYTFVVVPYCTGDVHLGDNVATYTAPARAAEEEDGQDHAAHEIRIHHKGLVNARAALDWTYANFVAPGEIFVSGSSAGAIPSPYFAWLIADHYPDARVAQLGDAAGGYRRSGDTNMARMEQWGTMDQLRRYPEFADMPIPDFRYEDLYIAAAKRHPEITFAEYDAAEDEVQKRFLAMAGNETDSLHDLLAANHADIRAEVGNFRAYVAGGELHTILGRPEFYTYQVDGRRIRDWVADLAAFEAVDDVSCEQCDEPELADGGR